MTEKSPGDGVLKPDAAARREAARETRRAKALKANLRRRKAAPAGEPDAS